MLERIIVERYDTYRSSGWMTWSWWKRHHEAVFSALQQLERGQCDCIFLRKDGIRFLSYAEYWQLAERDWQASDGPALIDEMPAGVMKTFREFESKRIDRLRQPHSN